MQKEEARKRIGELVAHFHEQIDTLKQGDYNETQTRIDFINPFFKALGWDVDNENGYAEAYREVIHEDKTKVKEGKHQKTKAPDYAFRLGGGKRLFFVEAKKPSVFIKDDIVPAYQLRRYGWSARLPISIITDFEEFAVYDCTKKPYPSDKASTARIKYITYKDYDKEFDFLWDTFSKEKVLTGSFDRFVQSNAQKRGTETVDKAFLVSLDEWRKYLATNIAWNNKNLNEDEINYSVQMTIDRIIFLRIAEDRFVEKYGRLKECLTKGIFYRNLFDYFKEADKKYNSGLFDFAKDKITEKLIVENKAVKSILNDLYYPESPFEFSVLPVEILGSAYEQFLGKVIRLTPGHIAKIDEKPEVRKAGGVYYTPQYIVEYIVENTVGKLIVGKSPAEMSKLRIVDPACGSGSFLIGAYQHLLNYHKDYYSQNGKPSKGKKDSLLTPEGNLTTAEKKRILTNNIYGVDIDVNAVEVTKLSLLLKCMEGETEASITTQMKLFHERVLPTLDNNIKDGNSLIDTDYYSSELDFGDEKKIKPFNWQRAFPEVFKIRRPNPQEELKWHNKTILKQAEEAEEKAKALIEKHGGMVNDPKVRYGETGGFDVVIGNPPYVKIQTLQENNPKEIFDYYKKKYKSAVTGNYDLYVLFIEKGYSILNDKGILGFIQPHKFFQSEFGEGLRDYISREKAISEIVYFGAAQIFEAPTTYTCLLFLNKEKNKKLTFIRVVDPAKWAIDKTFAESIECREPNQGEKWHFLSEDKNDILEKLNNVPQTLGDITRKIFVGLQTSADKIYVLQIKQWNKNTVTCFSKSLNELIEIEIGLIKPFLMGKDVKRYKKPTPQNVVVFPYQIINGKANLLDQQFIKKNYPLGWGYINKNKKELENRENGKMTGNGFYAYIYPKNLSEFDTIKIMTPDIANECEFTLDKIGNLYHTTTVYSLSFNEMKKNHDLFYIGILNSKLMWFHIKNVGTIIRGGYTRFHKQYIETFRIKQADFLIKTEKIIHNEIVKNVDLLLKLNEEKQETKLQTRIDQLQIRIDYAEEQINKAVYKLYDLTEEEIKIVEATI